MNLFYQPDLPQGIHYLDEEESRHAIKVFRLTEGDSIEVTDGKGSMYSCVITKADAKKCTFKITNQTTSPGKSYSIHVAIAPTKNIDRIEWFVEKAMELGVDQISFLLCDKSERKNINLERLQKLAVSALKQSHQSVLPVISPMLPFDQIVKDKEDQKFIAHVDQENPNLLKNIASANKNYLILIGPEGDFSKREIDFALSNNFTKVSLGPNRLRTETAGLAACHILNLLNQ